MPVLRQTMDFLNSNGNTWQSWVIALGVLVGGAAVLRLAKALLVTHLGKLVERFSKDWGELLVQLVRGTHILVLVALSLYVASAFVKLAPAAHDGLRILVVVVILVQAGAWVSSLVSFWIGRQIRKRMTVDGAGATTLSAIGFALRAGVWVVVLLLAMENLHINVTALVAGLGIGGVAIALAAQSILGDLFASLAIVLDKPFVLGDYISVGEYEGTVEHIGIKTTRVRSLSGEQLVFSNTDLLKNPIRNFQHLYERRVKFTLGVTYDTPCETLAAIGPMIRQIIESTPKTRFERANFAAHGDSALEFEVVYFALDTARHYMDAQEKINLAIHRRFQQEGIEFAFPTSTV